MPTIKCTAKQIAILRAVHRFTHGASVYDILATINYPCKRDAMLHSIKVLREAGLLAEPVRRVINSRSISFYALTKAGEEYVGHLVNSLGKKIKELLEEGYRPYEIIKELRCSRSLVEFHEQLIHPVTMRKARSARIEKQAAEQYGYLYSTSTVVNFDKGIKKCHECEEWKPLEEYHKNKSRWHGYAESCKACVLVYRKEHHKRTYVPAVPRPKKVKPPKVVVVKPVLTLEQKKIKALLVAAKNRARRKGLPNDDVTYLDLEIPEYCPVIPTIKLSYDGSDRWTAASLDRAVPALGYVKGNIQVMSMRANHIKNNSSDEERKAFVAWCSK